MKKIALALVSLFILLLIFGCTQQQETKKLQVAVIVQLTGTEASTGQDFQNGMILAKEKFGQDIDLYFEDNQSTATESVTGAKKLLDTQNIDVIVSVGSLASMPLLSVADQYDKPLLSTAVTADSFTQKSKNSFRLFPTAKDYATKAAELATKEGFANVSMLTIHNEYGDAIKQQFKTIFGGGVALQESFEVGERDFRTSLAKISDANSNVVYSVGFDVHGVNILKEREELGKKLIILSNQNMTSNFVVSQVGDLFKDIYATVPKSTLLTKTSSEFANEYFEKYGRQPDWSAPFGYDTVLILEAIQKSGKKPIEALHEIKINGLNGELSFGEGQESHISLISVQVKNGAIEEIK
jgi:branched-chain amino acid transport system substrate-binding protein